MRCMIGHKGIYQSSNVQGKDTYACYIWDRNNPMITKH